MAMRLPTLAYFSLISTANVQADRILRHLSMGPFSRFALYDPQIVFLIRPINSYHHTISICFFPFLHPFVPLVCLFAFFKGTGCPGEVLIVGSCYEDVN